MIAVTEETLLTLANGLYILGDVVDSAEIPPVWILAVLKDAKNMDVVNVPSTHPEDEEEWSDEPIAPEKAAVAIECGASTISAFLRGKVELNNHDEVTFILNGNTHSTGAYAVEFNQFGINDCESIFLADSASGVKSLLQN